MGVTEFTSGIVAAYNSFLSTLPSFIQTFINLFLIVLLIVIYCVFIWKLYRFISRKNLVYMKDFDLLDTITIEDKILAISIDLQITKAIETYMPE